MSNYPEHDRLAAVMDKSQAVGAFIDWLQSEQGYVICGYRERQAADDADAYDGYYPLHRSIESWLAEYFQIDPVKLELEKRAVLEAIRS